MEEKKIRIIVAEGCEYCESLKKLDPEKVELIDMNDPRAKELIDFSKGSFTVPQAFDEEGKSCEVLIEGENASLLCENKTLLHIDGKTIVANKGDESIIEDIVEKGEVEQ